MKPKTSVKKKHQPTKKRKETKDPRFFTKPKILNHLKNYSFLYDDNLNEKVKNMKRRKELEDYFVKKGKKRYFVKDEEKELRKMMRMAHRRKFD